MNYFKVLFIVSWFVSSIIHIHCRPQESSTSKATNPKCGRRNRCGSGNPSQNCSVSNDKFETQIGEWPHMCAIIKSRTIEGDTQVSEFFAGASLITPGVLLTAAHWVNDYIESPGFLSVRCGSNLRPPGEDDLFIRTGNDENQEQLIFQDRKVSKIITHPLYEYKRVWNDVGMLFVDEEFTLDDHIFPACLPTKATTDDIEFLQTNCFATGWGRNKFDGEYASTLKQVELPILDYDDCNKAFRASRLGEKFTLHKSMLCAGGEHAEDTCKGDGGGPLVCPSKDNPNTFIQVGITSWGLGCGAVDVPGVYASVPSSLCFIDWATQCVYGNKYQAYYHDIEGCDNWMDQEKMSLKSLQQGITERINGLETTDEPNKKEHQYKDLQKDVKGLQKKLIYLEEQCNAGEMILQSSNSVEGGSNSPNSNRKSVVRVAGVGLALD